MEQNTVRESDDQEIVDGACQDDQLRRLHPTNTTINSNGGRENGHTLTELIIAGLVGTSVMTLFSYAVADQKGRNFREPELLGDMAGKITPARDRTAQLMGWVAHYGVGLLFAAVQRKFQQKLNMKEDVASGLASGLVGGMAGVGMWEASFAAHPAPPHLNRTRYFGHLILAHLVFGMAVNLASKKFSK